jgi:flagellar hook-associated protein 1 FlgK
MLGLFGTLNMASQAMGAQMTGVQIAGQNLANVNTTGYSRQTAIITASPDIETSIGPEGTGAVASSIQQSVSSLLNSQIQSQASTSGYWGGQQTALQNAQDALDEFLNSSSTSSSSSDSSTTSDTGLSAQLSSFFSAFSALATSDTATNQQAAVTAGQSVATMFNNINSQLSSVRSSLNTSLTSDVSSANQLLTNIASLNGEIYNAEADGGTANDLLDAREQDLENLSQLTSISTSTATNGGVSVTIGGQTLVSGTTVNDTLQTYDAGNGQLLVQTATGGVNLTLTGGSMQGTIDARDGTLATIQTNVDNLASTLITQVNGIQDSGYSSSGGTGNSFFSGSDAGTITVNAALANNPSLLQISSSATSSGDTSLALQISNLATTTQSALDDQTFSGSYGSTVDTLGTALDNANTEVTNQTTVTNMLTTQRSSISGVDVDQEMTNMMAFQQAYEASAQVVTTVNTLLGETNSMMS